jgi:hypothetical protein
MGGSNAHTPGAPSARLTARRARQHSSDALSMPIPSTHPRPRKRSLGRCVRALLDFMSFDVNFGV